MSDAVLNIPKQLVSFIGTRDKRIEATQSWRKSPLMSQFEKLLTGEAVIVGGRASCGGNVDPTWVEFCAWREIVRKARSVGYDIAETDIKHGNGWATKCGGFWDEKSYQLKVIA